VRQLAPDEHGVETSVDAQVADVAAGSAHQPGILAARQPGADHAADPEPGIRTSCVAFIRASDHRSAAYPRLPAFNGRSRGRTPPMMTTAAVGTALTALCVIGAGSAGRRR
jgi:hypothetical protein